MKRKICAILLSMTLMMTAFTQVGFADLVDDIKKGPNTIAMVTVENPDCVELVNVKDLEVRLSKPSAGINITIPVQNIEIEGEVMNVWLGTGKERITDAVMKQLADIQGKIDLGGYEETPEDIVEDIGDVLEGFDVDILGLPADHYTYGASAFVLTNDIFKQIVELFKEMIDEYYGEFTTFKELIESLMKDLDISMEDLDPETKAIFQEIIANIDPLLAYLTSEDFSGLLICGATLVCACPDIEEYQIQHRYYERIDGKLKLVGIVREGEYDEWYEDYYIKGTYGSKISAKDFLKTDYNGVSYEFIGSYDTDVIYDDWKWSKYKISTFTLGTDWTDGLILRYVIDKGTTISGEKSPDTGDHAPIGIYIALLVTAILAAGAIAAYNKK